MLVHAQCVGGAEHDHGGEHVPLGFAERVGVLSIDIDKPSQTAAQKCKLPFKMEETIDAVAGDGVESADKSSEKHKVGGEDPSEPAQPIDAPAHRQQAPHCPLNLTLYGLICAATLSYGCLR